jgi:hypothetical protein
VSFAAHDERAPRATCNDARALAADTLAFADELGTEVVHHAQDVTPIAPERRRVAASIAAVVRTLMNAVGATCRQATSTWRAKW